MPRTKPTACPAGQVPLLVVAPHGQHTVFVREADVLDHFAVHATQGRWNVTHRPTGYSAGSFRHKATAWTCALRLQLLDVKRTRNAWAFTKPTAIPTALRSDAAAIVRCYVAQEREERYAHAA